VADLLDEAEQAARALDDWRAANLREMRRLWRHASAVPTSLVEALTQQAARTEMAWRTARTVGDFAGVAPLLAALLALVRETAAAKADALGVSPYDALLDQYDPGLRSAQIDVVFDDLAAFLPPFLDEVLAHQAAQPAPLWPEGPFSLDVQKRIARRFMSALGFDFEHGRLDETFHPFCGGLPEDVRVTSRYDEADFFGGLMAVLHETGHALYEQGLPSPWRRQPVGQARGMSLHESQSLLIEMQVCRSRAFFDYAAPLLAEAFGGDGPAWSADNLFRLATQVARGFIRVDADEVTYPAHVILRYRLEKAMIAGTLDVPDLPAAWNEGMAALLGVTPPDDRLGCLQDIHWYGGDFGYFPTYTLGAMTAAHLFAAARRDLPALDDDIRHGRFDSLVTWLRRHVHSEASRLEGEALLARATGRPLDSGIFKDHLRHRYLT
jgi:carboxypeptidase Taq